MAEESEQDTGAEASGAGVDPAAVALALSGASREDAGAFLKKQAALIDDQRHHLREQFKQLRLNIWQQRLGVLLRIATGFVGLIVAAGLAYMIWDASQSSGLLIEPFSVPPDLAARGITGEVVAAKLFDHLSGMQAQTNSSRAAQSYVNDLGQAGIKLEIPETGVSLSELDDFLREKLGHDTHITGEIVRTASGVILTARTDRIGAESVTGSDADFDGLVQQLGEAVYHATQPYRYGIYLAEHDRLAEALQVFRALAETGTARLDRAFAYAQWAILSGEKDGVDTEDRLLRRAIALESENTSAHQAVMQMLLSKSLPEQAVLESKTALATLSRNTLGFYTAITVQQYLKQYQSYNDQTFGDFSDAAQKETEVVNAENSNSPQVSAQLAGVEANEHDLVAARVTLLDTANYQADYRAGYTAIFSIRSRMLIDSEARDWAGVSSDADAIAPTVQKFPGMHSFLPMTLVPLTVYAEARLGKIADAEAHIAATPADCYDCLIVRARIAELEGQQGRADYWFARAVQQAPSIPMAYADWGQSMLERGQPDAAIEKFKLANQKGPKFADPLEMWGEALMKKNRSDLALAKFTEAGKYAPNWGRLHLKWGEALGYAGRKDEAQKQFGLAAGLDLSNDDKAELAKVIHG